jgi:hypothetical protein
MGSFSRVSTVAAVAGAIVLIGLAVLAGELVTAEPATRTLAGMVTLVESEFAKFDRDVHDHVHGRTTLSVVNTTLHARSPVEPRNGGLTLVLSG